MPGGSHCSTFSANYLSDMRYYLHTGFQKGWGSKKWKNIPKFGGIFSFAFAMAWRYHCIFSICKNMDESQTGYFVFLLPELEKRIYWSWYFAEEMVVSIKGETHSTCAQKRTSGHHHIFWSLLHVRAKIGGGLSMSEIWQLSFISSKSRHLSALCVSEIMLGSLANNWDREVVQKATAVAPWFTQRTCQTALCPPSYEPNVCRWNRCWNCL